MLFSKHELERRRSRQQVWERWSEFQRTDRYNDTIKRDTERILYIKGMAAMNKLKQSDGYEKRRRTEIAWLSKVIQNRIWKLQNPSDCEDKESIFLFCAKPLFDDCGWGCQIHHLMDCLFKSFATSRTLIIDTEHYGAFLDKYFKPVSQSCGHLASNFSKEARQKLKIKRKINPTLFLLSLKEMNFSIILLEQKKTELCRPNLTSMDFDKVLILITIHQQFCHMI